MLKQFVEYGSEHSAAMYIKSTAQLLWKHILLCSGLSDTFAFIQQVPASITMVTDSNEVCVGQPCDSYVSKEAFISVVNMVKEEILLDETFPFLIRLYHIYLERPIWGEFWSAINLRSNLEMENDFRERYTRSLWGQSGYKDIDGLPTSGTLIDIQKLLRLYSNTTIPDVFAIYEPSGIERVVLDNGIRVNIKRQLIGEKRLQFESNDNIRLEVVALGGNSRELGPLVCEFLNMHLVAAYKVIYSSDGLHEEAFYDAQLVQRYAGSRGLQYLKCSKDVLMIESQTHSRDYLRVFELLRLSMYPVFSLEVINEASIKIEGLLKRIRRRMDAKGFFYYHQKSSKTRSSRFRDMDPSFLSKWVTGHFMQHNMEINVVGDVSNMDEFLFHLNLIFGTLPLEKTIHKFIPKPPALEINCNINNRNRNKPTRHNWLLIPFSTELYSSRGRIPHFVTELILKYSILQKNLNVDTKLTTSFIFKNESYIEFSWIDDPIHGNTSNVIQQWVETMPFLTPNEFEEAKVFSLFHIQEQLLSSRSWLKLLRGTWLELPEYVKSGNDKFLQYTRDISQTDILDTVEGIQYERYMEMFYNSIQAREPILNSISIGYNDLENCKWDEFYFTI